MKIVVIGGSGLIGRKLLERLRQHDHEAIAASPASGVDTITGQGLAEALESGYFRGKMVQEQLIKAAGIPYTIVRSTQFFEFLGGIAQSGANGSTVRVSPAYFQPVAADDVAGALADISAGEPVNGTVELAGPERMRLCELVRRLLKEKQDERSVTEDVHARYFGALLKDQTLLPGDSPRIALDTLRRLARPAAERPAAERGLQPPRALCSLRSFACRP